MELADRCRSRGEPGRTAQDGEPPDAQVAYGQPAARSWAAAGISVLFGSEGLSHKPSRCASPARGWFARIAADPDAERAADAVASFSRHAFAMPTFRGRKGLTAGKTARFIGALVLSALMGFGMAERRGWVLGLLAFTTYGFVIGATALSPSGMRRWSAHHIVADALLFVPLLFFALLFIATLPWWGAAVIAVAVGAVLVPIVVRRRIAHQA